MTLTDFLLARIADDKHTIPCEWNCHERFYVECEAKQQIVEWATMEPSDEQVLYFLALPYADHPDYREEWRP